MKISSVSQKPQGLESDALVLFLFEGEKDLPWIQELDKSSLGAISQAINLGDFKGHLNEVTSIYTHGKIAPVRLLLTGLGKKEDFNPQVARNAAGSAGRKAIKLGVRKLSALLRDGIDAEELIEGIGLALFDPGIYKTKKEDEGTVEELIIVGKGESQVIKHSTVVVEAINWVRNMISEPANLMTPVKMVEEAKKLARDYKFGIEVISEEQARRRGFGAFAGIAKGSEEPSFIVVLKYNAGLKETLGVVGKGITFDSGGISIKPSDKMHEMKMDMAGAAACFGLMKIVGSLKSKVNVIMVTPLTENLPGGKALKPGDVLKSLSGKTIEVLNTDAEGRVVLADAITYVQKLGATRIVDIATLTGAVQVALGTQAAAVLGNKQTWINQLVESAERAGERLWQLPIYPEHKELLKSEIADVANIPPSRGAGVIAGAVFLKEFVEGNRSWAHLDIAATAWLDVEKPYLAKGPTGYGVRTLVKLVESLEKSS